MKKFILFFCLLTTSIFAANINESDLGLENSDYLRNQIKEYFYGENGFSNSKIENFKKQNIQDREEEIKLIIDNLITRENLTSEEATKKALEDKKILSINYILAILNLLPEFKDPKKVETELKNVLAVYLALKRHAVDSTFVHGVKSLISMVFMGHDIPIKDTKRDLPSNLVDPQRKEFFTKDELIGLLENGEDLSLLDPADSHFWKRPENISLKNPVKKFEGTFPNEFKFNETLTREGNPKIEVTEKISTGKKIKWRMKFGREINNEGFVSRLIGLLGYHSDEYFYVRDPKIYFKNKKEYEEMLLAWIGYYNSGLDTKPSRFIKTTGEDEKGFYVIFHEALLESRPKSELRVGDFHVTEMGNWERREIRALLLLMAFVNNVDFKPSRNNRVKLINNGEDPTKWEIQELVHDLGFGFGGQLVSSTANEYSWSFLERGITKLKIRYKNNQFVPSDRNPFKQTTYSDLKWMARYFVQITREQLEQIAQASGWPISVARLNLEKMIRRRNEIVRSFELEGQIINGHEINIWPEVDPKTFSFGEDIRNGKLIKGYNPSGFTIDYVSSAFEPDQIVGVAKPLVGLILNATSNIPYYRMASFPQEISGFTFQKILPGIGVGFRMDRIVKANPQAIDDSKAWITEDTLDIFTEAGVTGIVPITTGVEGEFKLEVLVGKQYKVSYYSPTPMKAIMGRPKLIASLPFKKKEIIQKLRSGESYSDGLFFEVIGREGIQTSGLAGVGVGLKQNKIFLNFTEVLKDENNIMKVSKGKSKSFDFSVAAYVDLVEILRIDFIKAGIKFGDKKILTYHFDQKSFENNYAFHLAAFTNKEDPLLENIPTSKSEIKYYEKYWSVGIGGGNTLGIASIGGNTSGIYNIIEDPEGNISRSFDYSDRLSKTTPVKNINYTLNGHLEFSDPEFEQVTKKVISLEYEALFPQLAFKEMEKQKSHINGLVNDKNFLKYTPENHSINHLGKTYINLKFYLKDDALSCIFEKQNCPAKGPSAAKINGKLTNIREQKNPIKQLEKLGPFLRSTLIKPASFKDLLQFVGGEKFSTELWIDSDVISTDRFIHHKKEALTI